MNEQTYYEFTGTYWWTEEEVAEVCKKLSALHKIYLTGIKGDPHNPNTPEECWAVTNRYDPRVKR